VNIFQRIVSPDPTPTEKGTPSLAARFVRLRLVFIAISAWFRGGPCQSLLGPSQRCCAAVHNLNCISCSFNISSPVGRRSIAISLCVCLSVWLSACIFQKPRVFSNSLYMLPASVGVARSSSVDGANVFYVLPLCTSVLWLTSCSHDGASGPESKTTLRLVEFTTWRHGGGRSCCGIFHSFTRLSFQCH